MTVVLGSIVVLWLLVASRLPALIRRRYDAVFWVALPAAIAATVNFPPLYQTIDVGTGGISIPSLISGTSIIAAFGLFRSAIVRAVVTPEDQPRALRRGMMQTVVAATMFVVAFLCALSVGATRTEGPARGTKVTTISGQQIDAGNSSDVSVFAFMVVLCVFLALVAAEVALACLRYLPDMKSKLFRWGFSIVAAGCAVAVVTLSIKIARQAMVLIGLGSHETAALLQQAWTLGQGITALLISLGLVLPALSDPIVRWQLPYRWRLLRLHRIWTRAATAETVILHGTNTPLRGAFSRSPRAGLHRALVEILDSHMVSGGRLLSPNEARLIDEAEQALSA